MSTRFRFLLLRSLPWLVGLTIGAAIIYLQNAGNVRQDREVLLQVPRTLPKGYDGSVGVRVFAYEAADSGDPQLIAPPATLSLRVSDGRISTKQLQVSAAGGLEGTVVLPEPIRNEPIEAKLQFELSGRKHELHAELGVDEAFSSEPSETKKRRVTAIATLERCPRDEIENPSAVCHVVLEPFSARFGGCVAGKPCPNADDEMMPWPENKWSKLEDVHTLPRYAVAIEKWQVRGTRGEPISEAQLQVASDSPIVVDRFVDGVWDQATSFAKPSSIDVRSAEVFRYQFRPDPFDIGAATTFVFDPSDPGPTPETLAKQEAVVYSMPPVWSWNTQREREAALATQNAKRFFAVVVIACALGSIVLFVLRWKSARPRAGTVSVEDEKLLLGRAATLVAGVFALTLLFLLVAALYLMRDFLPI